MQLPKFCIGESVVYDNKMYLISGASLNESHTIWLYMLEDKCGRKEVFVSENRLERVWGIWGYLR